MDVYDRLIRQGGFRLTLQRRAIYQAVVESGGHLGVEEVYQQVKVRLPTINLATVYRTLNFLCERRILVAADVGGRNWVFELAGEKPHHHLVCRTCGKVERIEQEEVQALVDQVEREHDFLIDMDHMALFGLCNDCRENQLRR
jgi:Fur family ferric uptake transcriptional regulator